MFFDDGGGGALRLMSRLVTLLAVADICLPAGTSGGTDASSETASLLPEATLALPKESFHFDGFFEIDGVAEPGDGTERGTEALRSESGGNAGLGEIGYGIG